VIVAIDFANWLPTNVTISSITSVTVANYYPNLPGDPAYITTSGPPSTGTAPISEGGSGVANAAVLQKLIGAAAGTARVTATITTSDGQTLIGWAHQSVGVPA
jgi:hypothetical protein